MPSPAEMVVTIETTLAQLYSKLHKSLTQKDRMTVLQDITTLEHSRDYWAKEVAVASGKTPRCADIDLGGF